MSDIAGNQTTCERPSKAVRSRFHGMVDTSEAVRRALASEHYSGTRNPSAARSWLRRLASSVADQALVTRSAGKLWFSPMVHPALTDGDGAPRCGESIKRLRLKKRNQVLAKVRAVSEFATFCRCGEGRSLGKTAARKVFAVRFRQRYDYNGDGDRQTLPLSEGSLKRWEALYREGGADALAADGRGGSRGDGPSPEAVETYWHLRYRRPKRSIVECFRIVADRANVHGWTWFASINTLRAWDRRNRNERALVLHCEGDQRYTQKAAPYIELDPESFGPGECWVGDDHTFNVWVRLPSGKIVRPVLSAWQCWRSRVITGTCIVQEGNEHSLLSAFASGADRFGLPFTVIADNGKNFTSWQWRGDTPQRRVYRSEGELDDQVGGIFALCEITASWCEPYNPNGKARLERWFRTLNEQCSRSLPSYCGNCPEDRPEPHKRLIRKAVEWNTFVDHVQKYIEIYNAIPHSGEGMDGYTPLQVMSGRVKKRVLHDNIRPLLLAAWHRPVSIQRHGVSIRVVGSTERYGALEPSLLAQAIGTKVRVSYDPADLRFIEVWSLDYKWLCKAERNKRMNRAVPTEALREQKRTQAQIKRSVRRIREDRCQYLCDPADLALAALARDARKRRLPDPPGPDGGPLLQPVQTQLAAPRERQPLRKAVGAEDMDAFARLDEFARKPSGPKRRESVWTAFSRMNQRESGR